MKIAIFISIGLFFGFLLGDKFIPILVIIAILCIPGAILYILDLFDYHPSKEERESWDREFGSAPNKKIN